MCSTCIIVSLFHTLHIQGFVINALRTPFHFHFSFLVYAKGFVNVPPYLDCNHV